MWAWSGVRERRALSVYSSAHTKQCATNFAHIAFDQALCCVVVAADAGANIHCSQRTRREHGPNFHSTGISPHVNEIVIRQSALAKNACLMTHTHISPSKSLNMRTTMMDLNSPLE